MARARKSTTVDDGDEGSWDELFDGVDEPSDGRALRRGLAFGFLAMGPLFLGYELCGATQRSAAELVLTRPFAPLGEDIVWLRAGLLGALMVLAFGWCIQRHLALGRALLRVPFEGLLGALLLGPATLLLMQVFDAAPLAIEDTANGIRVIRPPTLGRAAFVAGAAAWEELLFRVGIYSLLWMVIRRTLHWCGAPDRAARWSAEVAAPLGSALLFASFHLQNVLRNFGPGGEPFDLALFSWRTAAGVWLAVLFRLRGPGVAAWTHALFNVSLLVGAGPRVFL